ncbi:hypothetical protein HDU97_002917 [Phlyctochytrium planicorne]|nr:hypothetical protein HDU97_002917 [Phlyctochytrium planicorne]
MLITLASMIGLTFSFLFFEGYWNPAYNPASVQESIEWLYCSGGIANGNIIGSFLYGFNRSIHGHIRFISIWAFLSLISAIVNFSIHTVVANGKVEDATSFWGLNLSSVAGSTADKRRFITLLGPLVTKMDNVVIPVGLDLGFKILSLSPQNLSSYAFLATGTFNSTNGTAKANQRFRDFQPAKDGQSTDDSTIVKLGDPDPLRGLTAWASSNFDPNLEPKAFVCSGQLFPGSTSFKTFCYVDATSCRSGTVKRREFLHDLNHNQISLPPQMEDVIFVYPPAPLPVLNSFSRAIHDALYDDIAPMESEADVNGTNDTFLIVDRRIADIRAFTPVDPLATYRLDLMADRNATNAEIEDAIDSYLVNHDKIGVTFVSNREAHYAIRSVSNLGLPLNLPNYTVPVVAPVPAASPFIIQDTHYWNWTIHAASCQHQTLLCEAEVESSTVTKTWGCIQVPIFCDDYSERGTGTADCSKTPGIGSYWLTEDSLIHAIQGVKKHLFDENVNVSGAASAWNASVTELGSVIQSRILLEKALGLLHFAWSVSTLPIRGEGDGGLIRLHALRVQKDPKQAVVVDMYFLVTLGVCVVAAFVGGFALMMRTKGGVSIKRRSSWDPVEYYRSMMERRLGMGNQKSKRFLAALPPY